ncbi:MAG: GNAT family N-acetyltransferase [Bacteroidota bacterium]
MTNHQVNLRPALSKDQSLLEHWDQQPHVLAASGFDDDWDWAYELPRTVSWREQWIAEVDGRPIGIIQIIDPREEETHYWGEIEPNLRAIDIWIGEKNELGKGYGTQMMQQAFQRCFSIPEVQAILIDPLASNIRAHRFYERLGFQFVEKRRFGEDDCYVYRLDRPST